MEQLNAMRNGFNIVNIKNHLINFTNKDFEKYFVGIESYTAQDVLKNLEFESGNDIEQIQPEFKSVIEQAIILLGENHGKLLEFVKFISGSTILQTTKKLIITPVIFTAGEKPRWPDYPLPTSKTCFNKLYTPYIIDDTICTIENNGKNNDKNNCKDHGGNYVGGNGSGDNNHKNGNNNNDNNNGNEDNNNGNDNNNDNDCSSEERSVWNVKNVLQSFTNMVCYNNEAFSDA